MMAIDRWLRAILIVEAFDMSERLSQALTIVIGLVTACSCLAMMWYSFPRGLGLADESLSVYLQMHPDTPMPFMDSFVWGHLFRALGLKLVATRWFTAAVLVSSVVALSMVTISNLLARVDHSRSARLLWTFGLVMAVTGAFLYYSASRPTMHYAATAIYSCNIWAAASLAAVRLRRHLALDIVMGLALALAFMARPPIALALLIWRMAAEYLLGDVRSLRRLLNSIGPATAWAAGIILLFVALGYDISSQFVLIRTLALTSHSLPDLARIDLPYGIAIVAAALAMAVAFAVIDLRSGGVGTTFGAMVIAGTAATAALAIALLLVSGQLTAVPPGNDVLAVFSQQKSWGPAICAGALALILITAGPGLASRFLFLRRWVHQEWTPDSALALRYACILYLVCLMPQFGSNTGIWHRSIVDMGPLFLAFALLQWAAYRSGRFSTWHLPAMALLASIPIIAALYVNLITRPTGLSTGIAYQAARLNGPAYLEGVMVAPGVRDTQLKLVESLREHHFHSKRDELLPGPGLMGLAVLTDAKALGGGWYFVGYEGSQYWNCTAAKLGLEKLQGRVFEVNADVVLDSMQGCLRQRDLHRALQNEAARIRLWNTHS